jgi:hypothetical protein
MREHCLVELAGAWAQLVAAYGQAAPALAGAVLGALQRYVPWIDIGLVANDKCGAAGPGAAGGAALGPVVRGGWR